MKSYTSHYRSPLGNIALATDGTALTALWFEGREQASFPTSESLHTATDDLPIVTEVCRWLDIYFDGRVPDTMEELVSLPGVGRKTANVMLGLVFGKAAIAVDTHVFRVANRMGLATGDTPLEVERQLTRHIPANLRFKAHHWLLLHGRYTCKAQRPLCMECSLRTFCRHFSRTMKGKPSNSYNS